MVKQAFDDNLDITHGYIYQKKGGKGLIIALDLNTGKEKWEKGVSYKDGVMLSAERYEVT